MLATMLLLNVESHHLGPKVRGIFLGHDVMDILESSGLQFDLLRLTHRLT